MGKLKPPSENDGGKLKIMYNLCNDQALGRVESIVES